MITGKDIKNLRERYGLTQLQLGRAIYAEESTISNYENQRRALKVDVLESIANVFGYTVDFNLVKRENSCRDEGFYKDKSYNEILNMKHEDLVDYIFITQSEEVISHICRVGTIVASSLELSTLRDLLEKTVSKTRREVIYFKLNRLHEGFEEDVARLIDETHEYLELEQGVPRDVVDKVYYIDFALYGQLEMYEIESDNSRLLDKDKNDLGVKSEFIFKSEYNPLLYNVHSIDLYYYIKSNPIIQIKY